MPRTGVMGDCELIHGCWKTNQAPLQEQVLLVAEPSLLSITFIHFQYMHCLVYEWLCIGMFACVQAHLYECMQMCVHACMES